MPIGTTFGSPEALDAMLAETWTEDQIAAAMIEVKPVTRAQIEKTTEEALLARAAALGINLADIA
jgi:hypothetical protein